MKVLKGTSFQLSDKQRPGVQRAAGKHDQHGCTLHMRAPGRVAHRPRHKEKYFLLFCICVRWQILTKLTVIVPYEACKSDTTLCTLSSYGAVCQLHLNKTGRKVN